MSEENMEIESPKSLSFDDVNHYVHMTDAGYEDLQCLCLSLATVLEGTEAIVAADDHYFALSSRLVLLKLKGPVEDSVHTEINEAYEKAMQLRKEREDW